MSLTVNQQVQLEQDGFLLLRGFTAPESIARLEAYCTWLIQETGSPRAGIRNLLGKDEIVSNIRTSGELLEVARQVLGREAQPVRVILFDKSPEANWGVPWHQDLNIAVSGKDTPPGYGPRTMKADVPHIIPPTTVLEKMVTLRLHLDPCTREDGPLVVAPGSHRNGKCVEKNTDHQLLDQHAVECCTEPGDLLVMRPLLFHRSSKASTPRTRKVLHVEYAATHLDGDLRWYFH